MSVRYDKQATGPSGPPSAPEATESPLGYDGGTVSAMSREHET